MEEKRRLYKYGLRWTLIGFPIGCILYLILHYVFHTAAGFWMTSLLTAGYIGWFVGIVGGFFYICRHPLPQKKRSKTK